MNDLKELRMETEIRYDEYLYNTENRGISYGEIVYIQNLSKDELTSLLTEIENEEAEK